MVSRYLFSLLLFNDKQNIRAHYMITKHIKQPVTYCWRHFVSYATSMTDTVWAVLSLTAWLDGLSRWWATVLFFVTQSDFLGSDHPRDGTNLFGVKTLTVRHKARGSGNDGRSWYQDPNEDQHHEMTSGNCSRFEKVREMAVIRCLVTVAGISLSDPDWRTETLFLLWMAWS